MLRAFSTLGCPTLSLDGVIGLASRHAIPAVEIRALGGSLDLPAVLTAAYGTPERLATEVAGHSVRVVSLGTSVRLMEPKPTDHDDLLAYAVWAEALGARTLRVFDGGVEANAAELAHARALLAWWERQHADRRWSVDLVVETHDALAGHAALERFVREIPAVALLWDVHHTWRKGGQSLARTWDLVSGRTRHLHVKDSVSEAAPTLPYRYVLPGAGEFPMAELRALLAAAAFDGVLSLEWEKLWHPELPPLEDALTAAALWW